MDKKLYAFDLDGTVTTQEMLPLIAQELHLDDELALLTQLTLQGAIEFEASFRLRFHLLRSLSIERVQEIASLIPVEPHIEKFIRLNKEQCAIVTGNLDVWVEPFARRLGCRFFTSTSTVKNGQLELVDVLDKGQAMRVLAQHASQVVAIGESFNDIPMFEAADIRIAFGGVHDPVPELIRISDYVVHSGKELCSLLDTL